MKQIKGILFDKDGTLMDFYSGWVLVVTQLVDRLLEKLEIANSPVLKEQLLISIGLHENKVDPKGFLASGTTQDIYGAFVQMLEKADVSQEKLVGLDDWMTKELYSLTQANRDNLKPTADLPYLLEQLRKHGMKIGIATADDRDSTNFFLEKIGIHSYFDFIGTSDYFEKKPNPDMIHTFCEIANISADEVAVAGDTVVDLQFAKNGSAGLAIGVLSGVSGTTDLIGLADLILDSVGDIVTENGDFIWMKKKD
ncbi:phosphoglycolate phosphatase [Paenibacillus baekrokdamisoli]|uniref:Phosphoglycolate phosphatase n=1 Tax=Paenibacillus baekrokdamisoli TaxID=1712516 RepID=A0A3G9J458_9BACL|nr:HAD family hydrolase [Paenibacillus baekrokdamisoli]MBB3067309.1 phosphoglycolate phosphatase [Paenibacillus baekrokdamisoli]BBH19503.1 phosphoglycolate phosphatase [Paenibacillus baekrokdamisoli]